jgi:hypothetical protein
MLTHNNNKWQITLPSKSGNTVFEFNDYFSANEFYQQLKKNNMLPQYSKDGIYYREKEDKKLGLRGAYYTLQEKSMQNL